MPAETINCDACGLPPHGPAADEPAIDGVPSGWVRRKIGRRSFVLCDVCGSIRHFKGGISAYLQDALGVGPDAHVDFASSTQPGSGLHKHRVRHSREPDGGDEP